MSSEYKFIMSLGLGLMVISLALHGVSVVMRMSKTFINICKGQADVLDLFNYCDDTDGPGLGDDPTVVNALESLIPAFLDVFGITCLILVICKVIYYFL